MRELYVLMAALCLVAAPAVTAEDHGGPDDNATWGLCVADDNNDQGNESSNGTVGNTTPFANLTEEDCEDAEHPANGTPGEDYPPEDPGQPDDPGNQSPEDPGQPDDPGNGDPPEDPGNGNPPDDPGNGGGGNQP